MLTVFPILSEKGCLTISRHPVRKITHYQLLEILHFCEKARRLRPFKNLVVLGGNIILAQTLDSCIDILFLAKHNGFCTQTTTKMYVCCCCCLVVWVGFFCLFAKNKLLKLGGKEEQSTKTLAILLTKEKHF